MRDGAVKAHPSQQLVSLQGEHASATQEVSTWSQHASGLHGAAQVLLAGAAPESQAAQTAAPSLVQAPPVAAVP